MTILHAILKQKLSAEIHVLDLYVYIFVYSRCKLPRIQNIYSFKC